MIHTHKRNVSISKTLYLTLKTPWAITIQYTSFHISRWIERRDVSVATTTSDLKDPNTLPIKSTIKNIISTTPIKKCHSESLPGRCSCASRAATTRQARAIAAIIVGTARNEELDLVGDPRIPDWLRRATSQSATESSGHVGTSTLGAGTVRPSEDGDWGRHRQRGGSEESGGDKGNVELHCSEIA